MMAATVTQLPVSATDVVDYTPEYYAARTPPAPDEPPLDEAPHYHIGVATALERARWERAIEMEGARRIPVDELWAALERFIDEQVAPDQREAMREAVVLQRQNEEGLAETAAAAARENGADPLGMVAATAVQLAGSGVDGAEGAVDQACVVDVAELFAGYARLAAVTLVQRLQDEARRYSSEYAALRADHDFWTQAALYLAVRHFCRGWTGLSRRFRRANGQVTEDAMRAVPALDIVFVGARAIQLATLSANERKN